MTSAPLGVGADAPLVVLLEPASDASPDLGGKGSALARLVSNGYPVPLTGMITATAYRQVARHPNVVALVARIQDGTVVPPEDVDAVFAGIPLDPDLETALVELGSAVGRGGPVAVRSSATAEDLAGSSFAGQYTSLLNIPTDDAAAFLAAVRRVWASLWHPAPAAYRRAFDVDESDVAMAVVVMEMIPATTAGVIFTVDPAGTDAARVEAVEGLGESLVSGQRTPSAWVVPTGEERVDGMPLAATRALELSRDVAERFGRPQDIEWAAIGDDVALVQARPITVLESHDGFDSEIDDHELTTAGIVEMVPGVLPPLLWDHNRFLLDEAFRRVLGDLDLLSDTDGHHPFVRRVRGRVAIDFDQLRAAAGHRPGAVAELEAQYFGSPDGSPSDPDSVDADSIDPDSIDPDSIDPDSAHPAGLAPHASDPTPSGSAGSHAAPSQVPAPSEAGPSNQVISDPDPTHPAESDPTRSGWRRRLGGAPELWRGLRTQRTRRRLVDHARVVVATVEILAEDRPAVADLDDRALLAYGQRILDLAARGMAAELGVAAAGAASNEALEQTLARHFGPEEGAAKVRAAVAQAGTSARRSTWASAAIYGGPTWDELGVSPPEPPEHSPERTSEAVSAVEASMKALPGWTRRRILTGQFVDTRIHLVRRMARDLIEQLQLREATKAAVFALGGESRRVQLELGRRLTERGRLDRPDQIHLLASAEIEREFASEETVTADVVRRRASWLSRYEIEGHLPERFRGEPERIPAPLPDGDELSGWAASPGRHTGRARVVRSADGRLDPGEILVAEATDASWSPLFVEAGAVVVERGGPLSHAAILARELGIPSVLNVVGATRRLDGLDVTVDGDAGAVVIHDDGSGDDDIPTGTPDAAAPLVDPTRRDGPVPTTHTDNTTAESLLPWPPEGVPEDIADDIGDDRAMVFVPAIMSVGLVFSVVTLFRDLFAWTNSRARSRRVELEAGAAARQLLARPPATPAESGLLPRGDYVLAAVVAGGGAAYVAIGSVANFASGGYVRDIGWLLALSLIVALALAAVSAVSLSVARSWPHVEPWAVGSVRLSPLSLAPSRGGTVPPWGLSAAVLGCGVTVGILSLVVASERGPLMDLERSALDWVTGEEVFGRLEAIDPFGNTVISLGLVALIGLAGFRCRVMALVYPTAFAVSWIGGEIIRGFVSRPRPYGEGDLAAFPSGHMVQAVFIAGLLPVAIEVLLSDRRLARIARAVLGTGVVLTGIHRIHRGDHWPLDTVAGILFGLFVVLSAEWAMRHSAWHRSCGSCPNSPHPAATDWSLGLFSIPDGVARWIGPLGAAGAVLAGVGLAAGTLTLGLPVDPEGSGISSTVSGPIQLGLAALMAVAGVAAVKWKATAAFTMAVAATGLGLFASIQYSPVLAIGLTVALLVPSVLVWLAWQPQETVGSIAALALVTITAVTATSFGSREIHRHFFGATHPDSPTPALDSDAEWLWLGAVGTDTATVVAGGLAPGRPASLVVGPADAMGADALGGDPDGRMLVTADADLAGVARFELGGLAPDAAYGYAVIAGDEVGSAVDEPVPADAVFETHPDGAAPIRIAIGSAARSGSNGRVFDAIAATEPDLYLALGDMHYANLESADPTDHIRAWGRAVSQPAQAQVFSSIPSAYVWDGHDYGPDAAAGSRDAISAAYRRAVPHAGVDPNAHAAIAQAFTIGRVRVIVSDTRSQRTADSLLGTDQLEWLLDELVAASRTHALVIWANPTPWVDEADSDADTWGGWAAERSLISNRLVSAGVDNLVMVSGHAHMLAIDDGTNTDYTIDSVGGFPLLHAGALDRPGAVEGGPYSKGAIPGSGQFGLVEIDDDGGNSVGVRLVGMDWQGNELITHSFTSGTSLRAE